MATPGPEELNLPRETKLPLKIRIFLWQLVRGRLPSGIEVVKRNGPGDGQCPLCEVLEDSNHIFFICPSARFLWSCLREVVGGRWCHDNLPDLFWEVQTHQPSIRPTLWVVVGVLSWTLWTVCNKLVIEHVIALRATDVIYKLCGFL